MAKITNKLLKREKWKFLTTAIGYDRVTVPIFESAARNCRVPLIKTLMSSYCINDCKFCPFRSGRRTKRESWQSEQLANITIKMWKKGFIRGLFLSSSVIKDPNKAVEEEIKTAKILREHGFTDYIHLRLMPGVSYDLIKQSVQLADRVGINIEFPSSEHYNDMKLYLSFRQDVIKRIRLLAREVKKAQAVGKCKAGLDSQMIVGASNETDKEIIKISEWLYKKLNATRVYYSAFEPINDTPLENKPAENRWREYRLYQSSFLLQKYGFQTKDFVLENGMLDLRVDPKFSIALKNELCIDINEADFDELIKVPGIGIQTAKRIITLRTSGIKFNNEKRLKNIGVILEKAKPFIKINSSFQSRLSKFL